jgi:hypothetical protein
MHAESATSDGVRQWPFSVLAWRRAAQTTELALSTEQQ